MNLSEEPVTKIPNFVLFADTQKGGVNLFYLDGKEYFFIEHYSEEWIASRLPGTHSEWVQADIRKYMKEHGIE